MKNEEQWLYLNYVKIVNVKIFTINFIIFEINFKIYSIRFLNLSRHNMKHPATR